MRDSEREVYMERPAHETPRSTDLEQKRRGRPLSDDATFFGKKVLSWRHLGLEWRDIKGSLVFVGHSLAAVAVAVCLVGAPTVDRALAAAPVPVLAVYPASAMARDEVTFAAPTQSPTVSEAVADHSLAKAGLQTSALQTVLADVTLSNGARCLCYAISVPPELTPVTGLPGVGDVRPDTYEVVFIDATTDDWVGTVEG
jgi:hypothetical protein